MPSRSIGDLIKDLEQCVYLHSSSSRVKTKSEEFSKYYTPERVKTLTGYVIPNEKIIVPTKSTLKLELPRFSSIPRHVPNIDYSSQLRYLYTRRKYIYILLISLISIIFYKLLFID